MKRAIKFRVWDKQLKYMRYLDDGHDSIMFSDNGIGFYWNLQNGDGNKYADSGYSDFMQFTGLTDKNGREIYEGDIIEYIDLVEEYSVGETYEVSSYDIEQLGVIAFNMLDGVFITDMKYEDGYSCEDWDEFISEANRQLFFKSLKVVGNIYKNSDLLEV